jgi:hypothetical protein
MASTPNYAWPTPDNTDPVADGALDMRTLGDAIDSTVKSLNTATLASIATTNTTVAAIGAWTAFTPTISTLSGTITSFTTRLARYSKIGKTVHVMFEFIIAVNGTGGGYLIMIKPITGVTPINSSTGVIGYGGEIAISGSAIAIREMSTSQVLMLGTSGAPGYVGQNNARVTGFFTYEVP